MQRQMPCGCFRGRGEAEGVRQMYVSMHVTRVSVSGGASRAAHGGGGPATRG